MLQNLEEIIHCVGTKLCWVGGSVRTILAPKSQVTSPSAARGCHKWEQGRNFWVKLHFFLPIHVCNLGTFCSLPSPLESNSGAGSFVQNQYDLI